jgi:hypothetical protein
VVRQKQLLQIIVIFICKNLEKNLRRVFTAVGFNFDIYIAKAA